MNNFKRFLRDESGPELVEWAVVTILLLVASVVAYRAIGDELRVTLEDVQAWIECVRTGGACPTQG